jgi:hypothetical protein
VYKVVKKLYLGVRTEQESLNTTAMCYEVMFLSRNTNLLKISASNVPAKNWAAGCSKWSLYVVSLSQTLTLQYLPPAIKQLSGYKA